jgi:hypothetical protein
LGGAGNENDVTVSKFFQADNENEVTVTIFKLVGNSNDLTVTSDRNDAHLWVPVPVFGASKVAHETDTVPRTGGQSM